MKKILLALIIFSAFSCQSQKEIEYCCGAEAISTPLPLDIRYQNPDGSWGEEKNKRVYTSLMLIKLLHEGKTAKSKIYGKTITGAIKYLTFIEAQNILNKKENGFDAYLVLDALKLSNKTVQAEKLTTTRLKLEELLNPQELKR